MTGVVACLAVVASLGVRSAVVFAAGDANEAFCPQETEASPGFQAYLPDCRAYELVTPSFKDGFPPAEELPNDVLISPDGSRVIMSSLGVLAETGSDPYIGTDYDGSLYELARGGSGWSIGAVEPPKPRFGHAQFVSASLDLTRTAWIAHKGESTTQPLFVRGPGGEFVEVGPTEAPGAVSGEGRIVGADENLSTFILSAENGAPGSLWEGDTTIQGEHSLYEYTGTHQGEPMMVAVKNEGKLSSNKDAEPITACGNELGAGHSGSGYDAVSDDGDAVFFTANGCAPAPEVNELYVRVAGEKTLDLSEPPLSIPGRGCTAGAACETDETIEADRGAAVYQGASAEGTRVFFTSEQPLVNAAEGGGKCLYEETIAKEGLQSHVSSLALLGCGVVGVVRASADGSHVYFVSKKALASNKNSEEADAIVGKDNLYAYDATQGQPVYIATLAGSDEQDWEPEDLTRPAQASLPTGRYLVFASRADLTPAEPDQSTAGLRQLFEYDAESGSYGQLKRVSVGYKNDGAIQYESEQLQLLKQIFKVNGGRMDSQALARSQNLALTEAGSVFFTSDAKLTALALSPVVVGTSTGNPCTAEELAEEECEDFFSQNVYEYRNGSVYLISDGRDVTSYEDRQSVVNLISTTSAGHDAFFFTADSLVPQDGDTQIDIYDARVDGGFPAPVSPISCDENCQGGSSTAPLLSAPTSATYGGGVNVPPPASPPKVSVKPKAKALTRAQKLAKALKGCKKIKSSRGRAECVEQARRQFAAKAVKSKVSSSHGGRGK